MRMDAEKMKQVVINLVRNAIEAMPAGGVVEVATGMAEGRARLTVSDTGPGLPEDVDVFQLFVTTKPKGTGLGLSIVQQIVLQHGGEILAGRAPGGGARFTITLPALPAEDVVVQSQEAAP
jgi:signal transduction histidine kinase